MIVVEPHLFKWEKENRNDAGDCHLPVAADLQSDAA